MQNSTSISLKFGLEANASFHTAVSAYVMHQSRLPALADNEKHIPCFLFNFSTKRLGFTDKAECIAGKAVIYSATRDFILMPGILQIVNFDS